MCSGKSAPSPSSPANPPIPADELVPIFASAPPGEGGLGFPTSQLAPSLIFGGTVLTLWALWGFPALLQRWGNVRVCRFGLWGTPPFIILFPAASLFAGRLPKQLTMFLAMGLRGISSTNAFTACIVLVNALAPPGTLGSVVSGTPARCWQGGGLHACLPLARGCCCCAGCCVVCACV